MTARWWPVLAVVVIGPVVLATPPLAPIGGSPGSGRTLHVDCAAPRGGDGSPARPLDLAGADAARLGPGISLLLRRGTVCTGTLAPRGSGAAGRPIVIGAYGRGPAPRIDAPGGDAVRLTDESHVVVEDLELTSRAGGTAAARGVHLVADAATVTDVTVRDLFVHDVEGVLAKDRGGSGGIQLDAIGAAPVARFDGIVLEGNRIEAVSRSGIFVVGTGTGAPARPRAGEPWPDASTGVVVRDNALEHLAGDGIVPTGTDGAVIEDNTVRDGNRAGSPWYEPGAVCDAGIWAFDANDTVIQRNDVSGMNFNGCDGTGYDIDYDQDGTVVQDNFSHDNAGGFILMCTTPEARVADIRYNLSVDDAVTFSDAPCNPAGVGSLDGIRFTDNTIVAADPVASFETIPQSQMLAPGDFQFANNIVVATTSRTAPIACGDRCSNNLFWGLPPTGTAAIDADPRFLLPRLRGASRWVGLGFVVRPGSPAIGAGLVLPDAAPTDYFGRPVPTDRPPTLGFSQPPWG